MRTSSMAYGIVASLRASITDGAFELGEPLSEDALAEVFSVSRTPVREALKALQNEGIVEIVPKSGTFVFDPSPEQVLELCGFRFRLESWAMEDALRTSAPHAGAALTEVMAEMESAISREDRAAYNRLDARFHAVAFEVGGNRYLAEAYGAISTQVSALRAHLSTWKSDAVAVSMREHAQIVDLVRAADAPGVAQVLTQHIDQAGQTYVRALADREKQRNLSKRTRLREKLGGYLTSTA
ncbi:GntR family transcriptional regulator [Citricoccus sp. K5]|uniref:GntR family transcriptional regulator n=1 Tax=Citricoccus sp. K5 TaxID=2653135 RepID=UPI0012F3C808|nr:GntR family transcriptional regulator [Citricoccus sp. K5]VXC09657.1 DNA-binding transcriptional regulator, GntR family [Citricoccus sp. K5]